MKISLTDLELRVLAIMGEQAASGMNTIPEVGFEHVSKIFVFYLSHHILLLL